ncbi:hypothetical protein WME99_08375 [Sorangium sp. So ce136]
MAPSWGTRGLWRYASESRVFTADADLAPHGFDDKPRSYLIERS